MPGTPPAATPAPARPTPLDQLAPAQRAELPQMRIGGAIYSDQPASRFIVINGLVVREGETAAPGVVLERIAPKSAVIRWRDLRIEMPI
ncbi:MAG: general secretion pathway protein GspB [Rubrivivax sp.]|nr:general secretion pathway protein GspB [Rubrivivax sp.]